MNRSDRGLAAWIFVFFVILYAAFTRGHFITTDEVLVFQAAESLWDDGDLSVAAFDKRESVPGRNGERYAQYNSGQSIASIPFLLFGRGLGFALTELGRPDLIGIFAGREISRPGIVWGGRVEIFFVILLNAVFTAALCALFFLFSLSLGASRSAALWAAMMLGTSTYVAGFATGFFQHPSETFFLLLTFYLLFRDSRKPDWRWRALAGAVVAAMLQFRFPSVFGLPALFLYAAAVIWRRTDSRSRFRDLSLEMAPFVALVAIGFALHTVDEWIKFGAFLNRGYGDQGFTTPLLTGLRGLLFSPGHSIFLFTPLLLLTPWLFRHFIRDQPLEAGFVLLQSAVYAAFYAKFDSWHGMACFGPRYLVQLVPLLLLPLAVWMQRGSTFRGVAISILAVMGLWVQILHVTVNFWYVLVQEGLLEFQPPNGFLFVARHSQILAHSRALASGDARVDFWLLNVGREYGAATASGIAVALGILLLAAAIMMTRNLAPENRAAASRYRPEWSAAMALFALTALIISIGSASADVGSSHLSPPASPTSTGSARAVAVEDLQAAMMRTGLEALYSRGDAAAAADTFQQVLRLNPDHYGATYQLATALDRLGRRDESRPLWRRVLEMAESYSDSGTAATARARLSESGGV